MSGVQRFFLSAEQQLQRIHTVGVSCDDLVAFDSGDKTDRFIAAAKSMGNNDRVILIRHVLPNAIAPVLVSATFGIAGAILVESSLSFLGFGVQAPTPSWGQALSLARTYPYLWWIVTWPGLLIFLTVTSYNLAGEGLRDATDPRQT